MDKSTPHFDQAMWPESPDGILWHPLFSRVGEGHVQHPGVMRGDGSAQESPECRLPDQTNRRTPTSIVCGWSPPSYDKLCSQVKYRRADRRLLCGRLSRCTFHCLLSILNTTCFH